MYLRDVARQCTPRRRSDGERAISLSILEISRRDAHSGPKESVRTDVAREKRKRTPANVLPQPLEPALPLLAAPPLVLQRLRRGAPLLLGQKLQILELEVAEDDADAELDLARARVTALPLPDPLELADVAPRGRALEPRLDRDDRADLAELQRLQARLALQLLAAVPVPHRLQRQRGEVAAPEDALLPVLRQLAAAAALDRAHGALDLDAPLLGLELADALVPLPRDVPVER